LEPRRHPTFMQVYENSPDTTFIGSHLAKGSRQSLSATKRRTPLPSRWVCSPTKISKFACCRAHAAKSSSRLLRATSISNVPQKERQPRTTACFPWSGAKGRKAGRSCSITPAKEREPMMDVKSAAQERFDSAREEFIELSHRIHAHPELGLRK